MDDIELIINKGEEKLKEFQEIESLLSYPEIIADELYYKHLMLKKSKLNNIAKLTKIITDQIGQLTELKEELQLADTELSELINNEICFLNDNIAKNSKILQLILLGNSEDEIVMEIKFNADNLKMIEKTLKIYQNYCKKFNLTYKMLNYEIGKQTNYEIKISGKNAYKLFRNEIGIHKMIYDKEVYNCEIIIYSYCEKKDLNLTEKELRIDTFRASGAGGQHINRTNSAVRITHIPTGISVKCQNQRSQIQNKNEAYNILVSKLSDYYNRVHIENLLSSKLEAKNDYKLIREYDFNKNIATDLRLNKSVDLLKILNGELDIFNNNFNF